MIYESAIPLAHFPDDLSIPQFTLDIAYPGRPNRPPGHPWLIDDKSGKQYSLENCRSRTNALASALYWRYNLQEDSVAVIFSPNHLDYPIAIWACHRLGLTVSGANPAYTPPELIYQLETVKAALLFTHPGSLDVALKAAKQAKVSLDRIILFDPDPQGRLTTVEQLAREGQRFQKPTFQERKFSKGEGKSKIAFLSFSSGTTGRPKAVAIPHAAVIANVLQMSTFNKVDDESIPVEKRRFRPGDTVIGVLPLYHIYGLVVNLHWMLFVGMAVVLVPKFDYEGMLKSIDRYRISHLMIVPPMVVLLCKHPATKNYKLSSLRYVMVGAAPLSQELTQQFLKLHPHVKLGQGYGMTETSTTVVMNPLECENGVLGSAGRLLSGVQAKVIGLDGNPAKKGEPGELYVKSPSNALRYANNEQASKETFIDGWVRTGDEVIIDDEGNFFVTDRIKEIFKVKGFQVAPAELEGHILEHPDVADCAVIGIPDEYSGDVPMAFVTLNVEPAKKAAGNRATGDKIKESIKKHVADHKVRYKHLDGGVEFVDSIPKNPSGKLLRRVLREQAKGILAKRQSAGEAKSKL